jgi:abhydrolase domain-containing protein 13
MVEYRGYGNSEGRPSESGLIRDARAALDFLHLRQDINRDRIFVFGRSLGGAVSIALASLESSRICGLLVENTFTSIDDMVVVLAQQRGAGERAKWMYPFLRFFLRSNWHSYKRIEQVRVPILFLSGLDDELIPPAHMRKLFDLAKPHDSLTSLYTVPGGRHNDTDQKGGRAYYETIAMFVATVMSAQD